MNTTLMENRLIAFLDVLGFSAWLQSEELSLVHEKYSNFIDDAKDRTFFKVQGDNTGRTNFEIAQFLSDSLILVSNPIDDIYNVNNFIAAIAYLMEMGFTSNLPLRGAISQGDFLIDDERNIFLSDMLPEIVHFESCQEWSGCAILERAIDTIIKATFGDINIDHLKNNQICNNPIHFYNVPLKNDNKDMFVINYLFFLSKEQIDSSIDFLIEPKKNNVKEYFEFLNSLPVELQNLSKEFWPAVQMSAMKTRSGIRFVFFDKERNICKPGIDKFELAILGRWK